MNFVIKVANFLLISFTYLFELMTAVAYGRKPKSNKGKKQFFILILLLLLLFIGYNATSNSFNQNSDSIIPSAAELKNSTASGNKKILVTRVIDGDTVELNTGEKVRLIGMDAPELDGENSECFAQEAKIFIEKLVLGKNVTLIKDVSETDRFDRLLRYVYTETQFVNQYMISKGYAFASDYPPDSKYKQIFASAEEIAKNEQIGVWGQSCQATNTNDESNFIGNGDCIIKGNISWNGEKRYHLPNCASYSMTEIDVSNGEKYFCTEEEALSSNWEKAANCP